MSWVVLLVCAAQIGSTTVTGIVRDPAGAAIANATVVATELTTHTTRTLVTTGDGVYTAVGLPPGDYRLEVSAAGFRPLTHERLRLETGETRRLDIVLALGAVQERVAVSAAAPLLRAERASLGRVLSHDVVVGLPLNGRSFITLSALTPGVALPAGSQLPRINGGRPRTNEYLYDGISVLQPEPGQVAFFPIVDAIQEVKVESNSPPAEFGRFNGGVVNLTTRSGTNAVHGTVFDFARHEALNARNVFARTDEKPTYRRQQFGGVAGGPVVRDHTFFFVDFQRQRQTVARTVTSTVPTLLQRQGVFSEPIAGRVPVIYDPETTIAEGSATRLPFAGNRVPAARFDPVAQMLLGRYPLPTSDGTANNYTRSADEADNQDQFDVRIDHRWSTRPDSVFARVSSASSRFAPVTPLPDGSGVSSGTLGPQRTRAWSLATRYQRVISDAWLHELRAGDTRRAVRRAAAQLPAPPSLSLGVPGIPSTTRFAETLPTVLIAGYQQLGSPPNTATEFGTSVTEVADSLTWLKGRHVAKAGFDFRWERLDVVQPPSPTGSFTFTALFTDRPGVANTGQALASFLLGQVQSFSIDLQQQKVRNRAHVQEYFLQDDWKVTDRVTLNLGTRYTLNFPSTEVHDQAAVFNLETQRLQYLGRDGVPRSARRLHTLDFGPRAGVVIGATDKTILSSGYGLVWIEQAGITTPFTTPVFPFVQTVSQRTLDNLAPAFALAHGPAVAPMAPTPLAGLGQGVFAVDANLGSGYVQQWNVSTQHELTANTVVEVSYVGSKIIHVGIPDTNLNQLTVEQLALGPALLQRVPNPYYGVIPRSSSLADPTIPLGQLLKPYPQYTSVSLYRNNVGTSSYRGLAVSLTRRLSRGLTFGASYTRSRLMDDASSVFDASILTGPVANYPVADSFDRGREHDISTGDIPHAFVSSVIWTAGGWTVTALATAQSGTPVAVTQATNFNAFAGFGVQRPNLIGNPTLPAGERAAAQWFNTAAFVVAPQFTIGSAPRNPVRGPSYRDLDVALVRRVPMARGAAVELRVEVFNALNTPALGAPNAVLGAANFGTITSAGDPRVVQLAVKLVF